MITFIADLIFTIIFHLLIVDHLGNVLDMIDSDSSIKYWERKNAEPVDLTNS